MRTIPKTVECHKTCRSQGEFCVLMKDTLGHTSDSSCGEQCWLCSLAAFLDPHLVTQADLSPGCLPFLEVPWVKGTFQRGTCCGFTQFFSASLLGSDGAHQRASSCAGRLARHPICNLNSLTGRSSQAVHLRLQKVRLKYKEYPMPRALHKFCFDTKWERDQERGREGKALQFRPTRSMYICSVCSSPPSAPVLACSQSSLLRPCFLLVSFHTSLSSCPLGK